MILALLGPSGVGKTEIRARLLGLDQGFVLVPAWTTRPARPTEIDRVHVSEAAFDVGYSEETFLPVNVLYGARYATPKAPIWEALASGHSPLLDWPLDRLGDLQASFPDKVFSVYLRPPSLLELAHRLSARDPSGERFRRGVAEIERFDGERMFNLVDLVVTSEHGHLDAIARRIHAAFRLATASRKEPEPRTSDERAAD